MGNVKNDRLKLIAQLRVRRSQDWLMAISPTYQLANPLFQIGHIIGFEQKPTRRSHVSAGRFDVLHARCKKHFHLRSVLPEPSLLLAPSQEFSWSIALWEMQSIEMASILWRTAARRLPSLLGYTSSIDGNR